MLIPYGTDAPIYHFPRMTIVLIVANLVTFVITGMGTESEGWLLTYGNGLHPVEWVAYNFLHFGFMHLVGNMFFLWSFGIVVEGKLGWWKFLLLYLGIGVVGGIAIQSAMLGYVPNDLFASQEIAPRQGWLWNDNALCAQENDPDIAQLKKLEEQLKLNERKPNVELEKAIKAARLSQSGAGGASLIIYGLMAIVLIWAPRNEVHCAWIGLRSGTFEIEYLYFCGFYIVTEVLSAIWSVRGFEVSSEIGHLTGVIVGLGFGILMVKQNWVDCENWDLFSIMSGKHSAAAEVGDWQNRFAIPHVRRSEYQSTLVERSGDDSGPVIPIKKKKKSKPKPKLVELESFDEDFGDAFDEPAATPLTKSPKVPKATAVSSASKGTKATSNPPKASGAAPSDDLSELIDSGDFNAALNNYLERQAFDSGFQLPQHELRQLADGLFKAQAVNDTAPLLEEYIRRFPKNADQQCMKLAVLYVKFLQRPTEALKILARVDVKRLSDDHRAIHEKLTREAEQMVADGRA